MNCFNNELELKDTESEIKNKLTYLLAELKINGISSFRV